MKKWMALLLILCHCVTSLTVLAANPSLDEMIEVQGTNDKAALEALIRKEAEVNESARESVVLSVGDVARGKVNKDLLGLQCEVRGNGEDFMYKDTNEFTDGYLYVADELYDVPVARWGGTSTNFVNWWENIKPLKERGATIDVTTGEVAGQPSVMGPVEFIKSVYAINPEAKFIFNIPLFCQTPEETRTFIHFLLDAKDQSEYGALRASLGIENPLNVIAFELGNENYFSAKYGATGEEDEGPEDDNAELAEEEKATQIAYAEEQVKVYADRCIEHMDEVRKDFPDAKFYANVSGNYKTRIYADPWTKGVAQYLDSRIDGLVFHDYYNSPRNVSSDFAEMDHIQETYKSVAGHDTKFIITEHSIYSAGNTVYRRTHYAALTEAAYLNNLFWRDDVVCANYHNFIGIHWSLFRRFGDKYTPDAVNNVYKLYEEKLGTELLDTHKSEDLIEMTALATRRDNGQVVLVLVNGYQDRLVDIEFSFRGQYDLVHESVYTAPNHMSFIDMLEVADAFTVTETEKDVKNITSYTLPNKSLAFLVLEPHRDTQVVIQDNFDSHAAMKTAVAYNRTDNVHDLFGNWAFVHQNGASFITSVPTAQVKLDEPSLTDKSVTLTASYIDNTDKRMVPFQYKTPGDALEGDFTLEYKVHKDSVMTGTGVRFMIHNDGKNYYQLWLGGNREGYTWTFDKVVNNASVYTEKGEQVTQYNANPGGYLHLDQWVRITKTGNDIRWEINGTSYNAHNYYANETYTDASSFSVEGKNPTFGFCVNHSASPNPVSIDDVTVTRPAETDRTYGEKEPAYFAPRTAAQIEKDAQSTDAFVTAGEPNDVIYASLNGEKIGNVLKLETAYPVRKIVNNGETAAAVYVSRDDYSYEKLCTVAPGEAFANTLTVKAYSYIKAEGGVVTAYTALSDMAYLTPYRDMPTLLARINGTDVSDATFKLSDNKLAKMVDNTLIPLATGAVSVTANEVVSSNIYVQEMELLSEDFSAYGTTEQVETSQSPVVTKKSIAGNWVLQANRGTVNTNPKAYIEDGALYLSGASIDMLSTNLAYVLYDAPIPGLSEDYTISYTGDKVSVSIGTAIRFHIHNEQKNYYQLSLFGGTSDNYVWKFEKVEDNKLVAEATVLGPTFQTTTTAGNGPIHGKYAVSVRVNDGEISWTIDGKRYNNRDYSARGSYTDPDFTPLRGEDMRFGFVTNCTYHSYTRFAVIDDIHVCGRTVEDVTVKETEKGKYLFMNGEDVKSDARLMQTLWNEDLLEGLETYQQALWQNNSHLTLFVPTGEEENTKIFTWDDELSPQKDVLDLSKAE